VGERAGVAPGVLLDVLSKGSADSFALRNHGMKAMLPRQFPAKAFPVPYAIKDLSYTMELAKDCGVHAKLPDLAMKYLERALEKGYSDEYFPVIIEVVEAD
jgi:3-hydroxyisobutyrate dehydrogenase-like beta-hydroxyacid dehydrogenase